MASKRRQPGDILDAGPPRDEWAERAVLASVLLDPSIIGELESQLRPDDLAGPREQVVYVAMLRLHRRGIPPDAILVVGELDDAGHLDRTGDGSRVSVGYLTLLVHELLPTATRWRHYLARVLEVSRRRRAYYKGIRLLAAASRAERGEPVVRSARGGAA